MSSPSHYLTICAALDSERPMSLSDGVEDKKTLLVHIFFLFGRSLVIDIAASHATVAAAMMAI